jgi:hypothetical protein
MSQTLICHELLKVIECQAETIITLTNQNLEQENLINVLMGSENCE